ncbi:hypothetical protein BDZ45DRAFT_312926 [Acephala macrosclerotiorum]|nr:hypothetical protein BDZ45DRAFT_312926 [Acephala macrosclerotiorum]
MHLASIAGIIVPIIFSLSMGMLTFDYINRHPEQCPRYVSCPCLVIVFMIVLRIIVLAILGADFISWSVEDLGGDPYDQKWAFTKFGWTHLKEFIIRTFTVTVVGVRWLLHGLFNWFGARSLSPMIARGGRMHMRGQKHSEMEEGLQVSRKVEEEVRTESENTIRGGSN